MPTLCLNGVTFRPGNCDSIKRFDASVECCAVDVIAMVKWLFLKSKYNYMMYTDKRAHKNDGS